MSLTKNLELGNRCNSATALEYMAYGYLRRGDYLKAYGGYKAAAESYIGTICKDNIAKIKYSTSNKNNYHWQCGHSLRYAWHNCHKNKKKISIDCRLFQEAQRWLGVQLNENRWRQWLEIPRILYHIKNKVHMQMRRTSQKETDTSVCLPGIYGIQAQR